MKNNTLLIATWGNPKNWLYMKYKSEDNSHETSSFTSLELLRKRFSPTKTIILVTDTLAVYYDINNDYDEITSIVRSNIEKYLCNNDAEVLVLPGVIKTGRGNIIGKPRDFYFLTLFYIINYLKELNPSTVVLDITHGINYTHSLALKAIREALSLLGTVSEVKNHFLEVYNSDPISLDEKHRKYCARDNTRLCYPKDPSKCNNIIYTGTLHRILKEKITYISLISYIDEILSENNPQIIKPTTELEGALSSEYNSYIYNYGSTLKRSRLILKMIRYGLIPELIYYISQYGNETRELLKKAVTEAIIIWKKGIIINKNGGILLKRIISFDEGFRLLLYAYTLLDGLMEYLININNGTITPTVGLSQKLKQILYDKTKFLKIIQERELGKIKNTPIKNLCKPGQKIPLSKILQKPTKELSTTNKQDDTKYDHKKKCSILSRDILAHGGWHSDIVYLICSKSDKCTDCLIEINYDPECVIDGNKYPDFWTFLYEYKRL